MSRKKRRNHKPAFKAEVALAAIRGESTQAELMKRYDLNANQITAWKKQLLSGASDVFGEDAKRSEDTSSEIKALQAKIGQLAMEVDFLEEGLTRIHGPKGKKW